MSDGISGTTLAIIGGLGFLMLTASRRSSALQVLTPAQRQRIALMQSGAYGRGQFAPYIPLARDLIGEIGNLFDGSGNSGGYDYSNYTPQ